MIRTARWVSGRRRPRGEGFVLLEAVVALTILSTVIVAILATIGVQLRAADRATKLLVARSLAEERLAVIQLLERDDVLALPDSLAAGRFDIPFESYSWMVTVEPVAEAYALFAVEVVVETEGVAFPLRTLLHHPAPITTLEPGQ